MPKLPPLPPEFRAIRDDPDLTEDEKIDAVWDRLARRDASIIHPPGIPEDEFDLSERRERAFYQALRGKDGRLRMVALEPEICRLIIRTCTQTRTDRINPGGRLLCRVMKIGTTAVLFVLAEVKFVVKADLADAHERRLS